MPIPPGGPNFQASSQIRVKEQQSHFQHFVQRHFSQFDSSTGYRTDPKKISCKRHQSTRPTVKGFNTETVFAGMRMCSCGETTLSRLPLSSRRASDGKLNVKDDQVKCNSGGSKKHYTWAALSEVALLWKWSHEGWRPKHTLLCSLSESHDCSVWHIINLTSCRWLSDSWRLKLFQRDEHFIHI